MVDHRASILSIPTVQFDTAAASQQYLSIQLYRRLPAKLMPSQVRIVRRLDEVMGQRVRHFLQSHRHPKHVWNYHRLRDGTSCLTVTFSTSYA